MFDHLIRLLAPLALLASLSVMTAAAAESPLGRQTDVGGNITGNTTWNQAGSPYVLSSSIEVAAGATLRIEPGVEVHIGPRYDLTVKGRLQAEGSADQPISFGPDSASWGTLRLEPGSGPSIISHARFSSGGAGRKATLRIETSQLELKDCDFGEGEGYAVEIAGGAPTIRDSVFKNATRNNVQPPAAMQIRSGADPILINNYFTQNNPYAVYQDANANVRYSGNRFDYNGHNGVMLYGKVSRDITVASLGARRYYYRIDDSGLTVQDGGKLTLEPGTTLRFQSGRGLRVEGTLAIRGTASRKVLLAPDSESVRRGMWRDIIFTASSAPYDPATGEGSIIDHAEIISGGSTNGAITIEYASPRISNSLIRNAGRRAIHISGAEAKPQIIGNLLADNDHESFGAGIFVTGGAAPEVRFNIFRNNLEGLRTEAGSMPQIGPHNWFDFNLVYGVINSDSQVCVEASQNDWGDPAGPNDVSDLDDACGQGDSPSGGEVVSDNVRYAPFEGQMLRPQLLAPSCGVLTDPQTEITGLAAPGAKVLVYDNQMLIGETTADLGSGGDVAAFSFTPTQPLAAGSHSIQVRSERGEESSGITNPLEFSIDPNEVVDPSRMQVSYDMEGIHYVQLYRDTTGCLGLKGDGEWDIRPHPPKPGEQTMLTFAVPLSCPSGAAPQAELRYQGRGIPLLDAGRGDKVHEASFEMRDGGAIELGLSCGSDLHRDWLLGTITPEYEGFVYDADATGADPRLFRIEGARVTLFARDPASPLGQQWKQWGASTAGGQTNPQVTGRTGWYGWYPPPGEYRARVEAEGFDSFLSEPVKLTIEPFMQTIGLKRIVNRPLLLPWLGKGALR